MQPINRYKQKILQSFIVHTMLAALCFFISFESKAQAKPNIIFILADDLGFADVGFNGQQKFTTANIDSMAMQGMVFNQFYAGATVCAPSRCSFLTGMHTGHADIRGNLQYNKEEGEQPMNSGRLTIAALLKNNGYQTAAFGKWGVGYPGSSSDPINAGFDEFYGYNSQLLSHRYYPSYLWSNQTRVPFIANNELRETKLYAPDSIQQHALHFIDQVDTQKPFFIYLPYTLPHAELLVPDDSIFTFFKSKFPENPYKGQDYGHAANQGGYASQAYPHAAFAAMVTRLDNYVGQVLAKLKERKLTENTLIIFASDNGPHKEAGADPDFFNSNANLRGYKRDLYEGGIRTPFIAYWPGTIKPGTSNNYLGAFWDLLPTFAELAGIKNFPANDGISFVPVLLKNKKQTKHGYLYWEFHELGGKQAVREGNWKLIKNEVNNPDKTNFELYNLATDKGEQVNLITMYPKKAARLKKLMYEAHTPSSIFPFLSDK